MRSRAGFDSLAWFLVFETAYYFAYRYGMSFSQACASPFWFPNAVLLCALLKSRPGQWWIFVLATFPVRLFSVYAHDIPAWFLFSAFAIDSAKAVLGAAIAHRYATNPARAESVRDFTLFAVFSVLVLPGLAAVAGAAIRNSLGYDFWVAWSQWFLGNVLAQLVVAPFILYWVFDFPRHWRKLTFDRAVEIGALAAGLVITGYLAFNTGAHSIYFADVQFYAPVPFLFWAAVRFGMRGAAGAIAVTAFFAAAAAVSGRGPFAGHSPADTALLLQNFILLRSVSLYFIAAVVEKMWLTEHSLRESEARFRHMAHNAPVLIWMSGADKLCNFFNQVWLDFTGRGLQQELGFGWTQAVHPGDLRYCIDLYNNAFDARSAFEMEYRLRRHDGEYRWIMDKGIPRYAQNGEFAGYIGSAIDITDLKRAEEANRALAHTQRLAVMGELTAAIAHEVRQPLSAISLARAGAGKRQACQGNGPLTRKRMETVDDEIVDKAKDFVKRQHAAGTPFFVWLNTTHMHCRTHTKPESIGQAGEAQSPYHDTMIDHDRNVGDMLDYLDELGITDNTFVMYSTDNGPHMNSWPDAGMTMFRSEKDTNWEGAFRVPLLVRWPGKVPAGEVTNEIVQHHDWLPTFCAIAGDADIPQKLLKGHKAGDRTFKVHIDGYNLVDFLTKKGVKSPRQGLVYFDDDGDLVALRFKNWKVVFMEQRTKGTLQIWMDPFTVLRCPKIFNLRTDPYERADVTSNTYFDWYLSKAYMIIAAQAVVQPFLTSFKDYPPRQKAASFTLDQALEKMAESFNGGR